MYLTLDLMISFIGYSSVPLPFVFLKGYIQCLSCLLPQVCTNVSGPSSKICKFIAVLIMCSEVQKRICVAGGDPTLVESPTEPKWSSKGICN
jgi:hypothetical protein